ncbi:MAG TPA: hypothetical protein VK835_04775 [Bacteroidia bacterium]|nr:hypothetical protein [Bacteroidia bacterium]
MKKLIYCLLVFTCKTFFAQDTLLVPTQDGLSKYSCYNSIKPREAAWIKNTAQANTKLKRCKTQLYPDSLTVDFTQNDLIFYTFTDGTVLQLTQHLYKIPKQKKYVLITKTEKKGGVSTLRGMIYRLLYITPKLDTTYTLECKKIETITH